MVELLQTIYRWFFDPALGRFHTLHYRLSFAGLVVRTSAGGQPLLRNRVGSCRHHNRNLFLLPRTKIDFNHGIVQADDSSVVSLHSGWTEANNPS